MVATVQAIDVTNQLVTVVGPNNNWVVVKVGPEHIKLIKVKERITISYADEVATALRKYDGPPKATESPIAADELAGMDMNAPTYAEQDWVEATPHGARELTTIEISDTVAAVNRNRRTITFAGTGGKTRTIAIAPGVPGFEDVRGRRPHRAARHPGGGRRYQARLGRVLIRSLLGNVCFTPNCGRALACQNCPLCATSRPWHLETRKSQRRSS